MLESLAAARQSAQETIEECEFLIEQYTNSILAYCSLINEVREKKRKCESILSNIENQSTTLAAQEDSTDD
jgi:hypothetical protein